MAKVKAETEPTAAGNITIVSGEGLHRVKVSLKDLNRITCDGRISDPVYSKDKQMEIVRGGEKDLFIKISPVQTTYNGVSEVSYGMFPRELFVECMGTIHNFTLVPEDIATQTIAIRSEITI